MIDNTQETRDKVIKIETQVGEMHKALMGNGSPGLIQRVALMEGGLIVFKALAGSSVLGTIVALVFQFK